MPDQRTLTLPLLPLTEGVVLPGMVVTIPLHTAEGRAAADAADGTLLLVPQSDGRYATVGTIARVEDTGELPDATPVLVVQGTARARIGTGVSGVGEAIWVEATEVTAEAPTERAHELAREYKAVVEAILEARGARRIAEGIRGITDPATLSDMAGYSPDLSLEQKIEVLETLDVTERLSKVLAWARETLADLELRQKVRDRASEEIDKTQREFLLRQQLRAIQQELGEAGEDGDTASEYRERLDASKAPDDVREAISKEIDRLERTPQQNPEHGWIRTWIETMLDMPWGETTTDRLDIAEARRILDEDHTGLEDPKDRIVEYLAVRKLRAERGLEEVEGGRGSGAIVALVGPPGVGKTSLGESVARALGRRFVRVALGGVRDEAEIRGHRRTYVGAMPGRIARAMKEAGTMNPVFMLDEVDKVGADWRGDPSSALLEVLDPAQNHSFRDHYLEVDLDLSQALFIATANVVDTIPGPLLDRMEVIRLDGYTIDEKVAIARDHLVGRQLERNGLGTDEVSVSDEALEKIVTGYTREAGVRNLEREIGKAFRKAATRIASGEATPPIEIGPDGLREFLGRPKVHDEAAERTSVPGVATGLAVTGTGGDVLFVEASSMPGESGLQITGQLGDVMRESAEIALSYVRSHAAELGIDPDALAKHRFHLHVPAGAIPKDGPSAGVTMTTALVSLLTGRPAKATVGMTGEVTLSGRVLEIGGVKQKVLAAHRAGLREVILPKRNEGDLEDVPDGVREEMTFHLVEDVDDVLHVALAEGTDLAA